MAHLKLPDLSTANSSSSSLHKIANVPGYATPPFAGKAAQKAEVHSHIADSGFIPQDLVAGEVEWFYNSLRIDDTYFEHETVDTISNHIIALYGAKVLAYTKHEPNQLVIDLEKKSKDTLKQRRGVMIARSNKVGFRLQYGIVGCACNLKPAPSPKRKILQSTSAGSDINASIFSSASVCLST